MKIVNIIALLLLVSAAAHSQTSGVLSFDATRNEKAIAITWTPSVEPVSNHFEIQRSEDGTNWKTVAIMFPFENEAEEHTYLYNDKPVPAQNTYYRIRQVDINKKENFSKAKMI